MHYTLISFHSHRTKLFSDGIASIDWVVFKHLPDRKSIISIRCCTWILLILFFEFIGMSHASNVWETLQDKSQKRIKRIHWKLSETIRLQFNSRKPTLTLNIETFEWLSYWCLYLAWKNLVHWCRAKTYRMSKKDLSGKWYEERCTWFVSSAELCRRGEWMARNQTTPMNQGIVESELYQRIFLQVLQIKLSSVCHRHNEKWHVRVRFRMQNATKR